MSSREKIIAVINRIGQVADSVTRKISWFVALGGVATGYLAWQLYSPESAWWWNSIKCGLVSIPALIWVFVWSVFNQLRDAPMMVSELARDESGVLADLQNVNLREPDGMKGVFSALNEFRKEDGLSVIFDTISGVGLIANPVFAFLAFISMGMLFMLISVAALVLVF